MRYRKSLTTFEHTPGSCWIFKDRIMLVTVLVSTLFGKYSVAFFVIILVSILFGRFIYIRTDFKKATLA